MGLQFILGSSGAGKSTYIYNKIIEESIANQDINYIILVPEQYSLALQRKLIMMHPNHGYMNIDVIGFNRLNYRIFDELGINTGNVLEDFGKTMLMRQVVGEEKDNLKLYGGSLEKSGFIDELKSLMSELYQYDIKKDKLDAAITYLEDNTQPGNMLLTKLTELRTIFAAFERKKQGEYIVAEQLSELLAENISKSNIIKNSVIVMDGFTGFTPIQLKIIEQLLVFSKKLYMTLTIDKSSYGRRMEEHDLFYLTSSTMNVIKDICINNRVEIFDDIILENDIKGRWKNEAEDIAFLERNLFRYPYDTYKKTPDNIFVNAYENTRDELNKVGAKVRQLVMKQGYRYKDIAIISGNLEGISEHVENIFSKYDIPVFLDAGIPLKNNACVDSIGYLIRIVEENFSYDSVFSFLKSGVYKQLDVDDVEIFENYVISKGMRGFSWWKKSIKDEELNDIRTTVLEILEPFYEQLSKKKYPAATYAEAVLDIMNKLSYEEQLIDNPRLYEKLVAIFEKIKTIMADDIMEISLFREIYEVGLKSISLGMIPAGLDSVVVGDITRSRLDDIRALFIIGMNDGVIPKSGNGTGLITDREKEELDLLGLRLAPTDKMNSYTEQFYLYNHMTKPSEKLYLSYVKKSSDGQDARPSYVVGRIKNIFPDITVMKEADELVVTTGEGSILPLIAGLRKLMNGDFVKINEVCSLYRLYADEGEDELLSCIDGAFTYNNIPDNLTKDVRRLIELRTMSQSVSRIEKFANCAYSYFLRYTLGVKERKTCDVDDREIGVILHSAMEKLYVYVRDNLDNKWADFADSDRDRLVTEYVGQVFDEFHETDGKLEYLKNALSRIAKRSAKMLADITVAEGTIPKYFEYPFKKEITLADGHKIKINGVVDRGDVYYSKEEEALKLRIIDYKSGNYEFDISKLYDGVRLQLAVYMNVMQEYVSYKTRHEYKRVIPEGMYYYRMQDPYVNAENDEAAAKERQKNLKLYGVSYADSEKFDASVNYAMYKVDKLVEEMLEGKISKNPMKSGHATACTYCEFSSVCRFDNKCGGNKYRYPTFKKSDKDKIYARIKEELGGGTDAVD